MVSIDAILNRIISPVYFAVGSFILFGGVMFVGFWFANEWVMFSSFGFFLSGVCIAVLHVVDKWHGNRKEEKIEEIKTVGGVVANGTQKNVNKVQATIEL